MGVFHAVYTRGDRPSSIKTRASRRRVARHRASRRVAKRSAMSLDARQRCVFEAKLAEQAERHDGASTSDAIDGAIDGATDERRIDRVEARAGARGASRIDASRAGNAIDANEKARAR
jgi:hypothetical protein